MMLRIGNHLPSSKGYLAMGKHAVKLGATTFAFFTRNPRGGTAKPIAESDATPLYSSTNAFSLSLNEEVGLAVCKRYPNIQKK